MTSGLPERSSRVPSRRTSRLPDTARSNFWGGIIGNGVLAAGSIVVAVIGLQAINDDTGPAPPPIDCVARRVEVRDLLKDNPVWAPLPSTSQDEEQCTINEYVDQLLKSGAGGGSSGGF